LNTLSGNPISMYQIFYLFCKALRFGFFTLVPVIANLARTISNLSRRRKLG
jgi:hypothetical protein